MTSDPAPPLSEGVSFRAGVYPEHRSGQAQLGFLGKGMREFDYDVFPIPVLETPAAVLGGENLFVFKSNSQREQASLEFLEYVLSEDFQTTWALKTGYLPINIKSQKSDLYQQFVQENPVLEVFLEQMKYTQSRPIIPKYTRLSENLGRAIKAALLGSQTPEEALQRSQKRLELIFNDS